MHGVRINIGTPWAFVIIGLLGGQVQARQSDGTYGDTWTWLSIERGWLAPAKNAPPSDVGNQGQGRTD